MKSRVRAEDILFRSFILISDIIETNEGLFHNQKF
jgi:hypothetical protein